ncbi:MAG: TAXI family TRAP transporter solute-binding subunit [Pseudomonadota bacterium]
MSVQKPIALVFVLLAVGLGGFWAYESARTYHIAIAAGPRNGQAFKLMSALQEVARRHAPEIVMDVYETRGSLENAQLLGRGSVQLATTQADQATSADTRMVAELFPDTFQLIVRPESGIRSLGDLAGKRLALPPEESGEFKAFWFLAGHYGLRPADIQTVSGTDKTISWVFLNGDVDALFRVRPTGDPGLFELIDAVNGRVLPISQAKALQQRQPALQAGTIPLGAYRGRPPVPAEDLPTVAVKLLLAVRDDVPENVVFALTSILFERRRELVTYEPLAGSVSEPARSAGTFVPLHAGARQFYDRNQPSFLQENAEPIALIVSIIVVLGSILMQLASLRRKREMDRYNGELMALAEKARHAGSLETIDQCDEELSDFVPRIVAATRNGHISAEQFDLFHFTYDAVEDAIRDRETQLLRQQVAAEAATQPQRRTTRKRGGGNKP